MTRAVLILCRPDIVERAINWIRKAPPGTRVEFKAPKRTLPQNDKFWATATDIAKQVQWHGLWLTPEDWRLIFLDSLKREVRIVPNMDGTGFVQLGRSTSDLSVAEMADLITLMHAFGAQHGVRFNEPLDMKEAA
jgi:hypothetical protein